MGPDDQPAAAQFAARPAPDATVPVVRVRGLAKRLGRRVQALDGVDLRVEAGQCWGLIGSNGAGKSTLLRVLLGLVRPDSGEAELFGRPTGPGASVLARVGALVDGPGFLPYLSGRANLLLAARSSGRLVTTGEIDAALASSGLGPALDRPYRTYSHGMRYRLGLAQALMGTPDLLLLDEPTTGLDPMHADEVDAAVARARAAGVTILLSSHELSFIESVCSHATIMHQGRVVATGQLDEVIAGAGSLERAYRDAVRVVAPAGSAR